MKLFGKTHIIFSVLTFAILFAMNYIANENADRLSTALLNAVAGVIGLGIGIFILYKGKNNDSDKYQNFD